MARKAQKKAPEPRPLIEEPESGDWSYRTLPKRKSHRTPATPGGSKQTPERKRIILEVLAQGWSYTRAGNHAGVSRQTIFHWRNEDPEFARQCEEAIEAGTDILEDEATRRAAHGVDKPLLYQGDVVASVKEYSDALMQMALKGRRRNKFGDQQVLSGPDDGPIQLSHSAKSEIAGRIASLAKRSGSKRDPE